MAKLNVPPTKSTSLKLSRELSFAEEGFQLLEEKREILVFELMSHLAQAEKIQEEVNRKLASAFEVLKEALSRSGSLQLQKETMATRKDHRVEVAGRRLMGINLPRLAVTYQTPGLEFSFREGSAKSDEVMKRFFDALGSVEKLAEIETTILGLARELRRTQRRVNALEKIFIPTYRETLAYVRSSLEEREREGLVILKMIKARRERSAE